MNKDVNEHILMYKGEKYDLRKLSTKEIRLLLSAGLRGDEYKTVLLEYLRRKTLSDVKVSSILSKAK